MKKLWHKLAHLTGLISGNPDAQWRGDKLIMYFKCGYCGKLTDGFDTSHYEDFDITGGQSGVGDQTNKVPK